MSEVCVEIVEVGEVKPHPNADRLEIATVRGATVVIGKGSFAPGEHAAYFPPDILLPDEVADRLGVTKYLKHAEYDPGKGHSQCRVAGARLRGQPSFGFLSRIDNTLRPGVRVYEVGENISDWVGAKKYTPPPRVTTTDAAADHPAFHKYTDIENINRYPQAIPEGTLVRITEKIHGTNCRVGIVDGEIMAGSHRLRRKQPIAGANCMYWHPLAIPGVRELLNDAAENTPVIIFGEVYGTGVQDMDYGCTSRGFRIFDISVNGRYLDYHDLCEACESHGVEMVPVLYAGNFSRKVVDEHTYGPTTIGTPRGSFKGREGVVITPLMEKHSEVLGGRMILKSISADYLDRKGAEDNE